MTEQKRELPSSAPGPALAPVPLPRRIPGRQAIPGPGSLRPAAALRLPRTVPDPDGGSRGAFEPPPKTAGATGERPGPPAAPARQAPGPAGTGRPWPAVLATAIRLWVRRRVRGSGQASRGRGDGGGSQA